MGLTRFKDPRATGPDAGFDGPVSGALQVFTVAVNVAATATHNLKVDLPAGMRFRVTDISMRASAVAASPTIIVGVTTNGSSALVASTAVTTNLGALTVKTAARNVAAGDVIVAQVLGTVTGGVLTVAGHVSAPPTSVIVRSASHF